MVYNYETQNIILQHNLLNLRKIIRSIYLKYVIKVLFDKITLNNI